MGNAKLTVLCVGDGYDVGIWLHTEYVLLKHLV